MLGINALRAAEAATVRIEDDAETLRGHRVLHLVGKGSKRATMPLAVPVLRVLEAGLLREAQILARHTDPRTHSMTTAPAATSPPRRPLPHRPRRPGVTTRERM